ncbi:helix-turn-helix transcriptional regulator [Nocardia sp. BMG51109]|uniref:helix-turn-helix domain-containing protein n=1 Tax=Nocardia sp. BMG51109 TaxID=1056816 RepID=UPI0004668A7F|nr:helix-turn-helix transcriptional regulator [Nocardia sp. BMG51109]
MTITLEHFSCLVVGIYGAVSDPSRWDSVIGDITAAFGAEGGHIVIPEPSTGRFVVRSSGIDSLVTELLGPIAHAAERVRQLPAGTVMTYDEVISAPERWRGVHRTDRAVSDCFVTRLTEGVPASWICLAGPERLKESGNTEGLKLMRALVPHLGEAVRTQSDLAKLTHERNFAHRALDAVRYGVMIVSADAEPLFANSVAESITRHDEGLTVDACGRLCATTSSQSAALRHVIRRVAESGSSADSLALTRPSGPRPLVVHVAPLDGDLLSNRVALVLVVDPDGDTHPEPAVLQQLYGLTEAEATVATAVLGGGGVQAVATKLSLSPSTVRTHLRHIFTKTSTHRQAELIRLLLTVTTATS